MATATAALPLNLYLSTTYSPDLDYVDGEVEKRNLGEFEHARMQALLAAIFIGREGHWGVQTVVEQRIRISESRVRVCDVALLRADAPREAVITTPPLLCLEILSPEDRLARAQVVLADYLAMGVPNLWLIDPLRRSAHTFDREGLHYADPAKLAVANNPVELDLTKIFEALD